MGYFSEMGTEWITLDNGNTLLMNNITKFTTYMKNFSEDPHNVLQYRVGNGERPEQVSYKAYGTVSYWWTILLLNDIMNVRDQWALSQDQLETHIAEKYPFSDPGDVHHYVTPEGFVADFEGINMDNGYKYTDHNLIIDQYQLTPVSIYDFEYQSNENKRDIMIIDPDKIFSVASKYKELMNG